MASRAHGLQRLHTFHHSHGHLRLHQWAVPLLWASQPAHRMISRHCCVRVALLRRVRCIAGLFGLFKLFRRLLICIWASQVPRVLGQQLRAAQLRPRVPSSRWHELTRSVLLSPLSDAASFLARSSEWCLLEVLASLVAHQAKAADLSLKRKDVAHALYCCNQAGRQGFIPANRLSCGILTF